jgi:hypothetical protein
MQKKDRVGKLGSLDKYRGADIPKNLLHKI